MARLKIANNIQGSHQLVLRRMSVKVLLGATNVSTTRSTWESGGCSTGATGVTELMGLLLFQTRLLDRLFGANSMEFSVKPQIGEIVSLRDVRERCKSRLPEKVENVVVQQIDGRPRAGVRFGALVR
jgi:hypothetical protein